MITLDKAKLFARFNGDGDMYYRLNDPLNRIITGEEWSFIDSFLQDYTIINNGYASKEFINNLDNKALTNCDSAETIDFLKSLVKNRAQN